MSKRIPSKLPVVLGNSPVAQGFRMAFLKINEILEYLEATQPSDSADSYTGRTVAGVTRRPKAGAGTGVSDGEGSRWA